MGLAGGKPSKAPPSYFGAERSTQAVSANVQVMATILFAGFLERFPELKIVSSESGVGWVPYLLEVADHHWDHANCRADGFDVPPSELFKRQCYVNFWFESKRPMLGVITTIPVVIVVVWTFGIMAALGIPFGPVTATISALAIGIGIPYMIHVTHRYLEEWLKSDVEPAMRTTLVTTGSALIGSALTTALGFSVLLAAPLVPMKQLGLLTAIVIVYSLVAAFCVLPAALTYWSRWHQRRHDTPAERRDGAEPSPATTEAPVPAGSVGGG